VLRFVADVSAVCAWCFEDERSEGSEALLARLPDAEILVPALFLWELGNVMLMAERRGRISAADRSQFLSLVGQLDLAMRAGLPLASRDSGLIGAARTCGLALLAC
jgi:predicted nucleic acid-binding protein